MNQHFTEEELYLFNSFCLREFYMSLDLVRSMVASGLTTKKRNARGYKQRQLRKKEKEAIAKLEAPEDLPPPQIDYIEFEDRFPKVYSTGMSSSDSFSSAQSK